MPTVQGSDNFDHAIDAGYYTDGFFSPGAGNPEAVISPLYRSQAKSLHITTGAGNSGVRHNEMIFDVSGTSHNVYGRIGGVDMTAPTAFSAGSASTVDFHQLLSLADDSGTVSDYYSLWEWGQATSNADWLGEPGAVVAVSFMSGVGW